ncbi:uncharacterized protein TrAtP1_004644 [Trichoderma atroviride]|uniref:uncharacterized protein n=1 Tax=Hypocrea atroviridis TaxID=63577 RepID=UPI00331CB949|nr:hypothetical protein TrAtP1_004644 [Trichoderma atroviride]
MMRLRGTLGRRRKHMQFSSHIRKGASSLAPQVCNVIQVSHHVPLPAPLAVEFGDCWHVQVLVLLCTYLSRPRKATWQGVHVSNKGSNLVSVIQRQGKQWSVPCDS